VGGFEPVTLPLRYGTVCNAKLANCCSGVARNLSRVEQIRGGLGDGSPPDGPRGGGLGGEAPQKLTSLPLKCSKF